MSKLPLWHFKCCARIPDFEIFFPPEYKPPEDRKKKGGGGFSHHRAHVQCSVHVGERNYLMAFALHSINVHSQKT